MSEECQYTQTSEYVDDGTQDHQISDPGRKERSIIEGKTRLEPTLAACIISGSYHPSRRSRAIFELKVYAHAAHSRPSLQAVFKNRDLDV